MKMPIRTRIKPHLLVQSLQQRSHVPFTSSRSFTISNSIRNASTSTSGPDPGSGSPDDGSITCSTHLPPRSVVFSGIQPTGEPHLGNYLGALRQWVKIQDEAPEDSRLVFSIVDLHAITVPGKIPEALARCKREGLAALLAVGLRRERCVLFWQSDVPAHSELMWILSCQASTGMLSRMTQWKDKSSKEGSSNQRLGLFSYPVLQAADVLVHGATHVPVGEDQTQHLEFARYTARAFNHSFRTDILKEPTTIISPTKRIMSLTDPSTKMSKSSPSPRSRISLLSSPTEIRKSIRQALTDMSSDTISYSPSLRPGISNLLDILGSFDPERRSPEQLASQMKDVRQLKHETAEAVVRGLEEVRERYHDVMGREGGMYIDRIAEEGAERAKKSAGEVMKKVKEAVGLGGAWEGWREKLKVEEP